MGEYVLRRQVVEEELARTAPPFDPRIDKAELLGDFARPRRPTTWLIAARRSAVSKAGATGLEPAKDTASRSASERKVLAQTGDRAGARTGGLAWTPPLWRWEKVPPCRQFLNG